MTNPDVAETPDMRPTGHHDSDEAQAEPARLPADTNKPSTPAAEPTLRRSQRDRRPPPYLTDYVQR